MKTVAKSAARQKVTCEVCLARLPRIDALRDETPGRVAYFCGARCYQRWRAQRQAAAPPRPA
jgi:hypothetical protein